MTAVFPTIENMYSKAGMGIDMTGVDLYPVTPDDDADLPKVARALRCTAVGDVSVTTVDGSSRTWTFYNQGEVILCGVQRVLATDTTASVEAYV